MVQYFCFPPAARFSERAVDVPFIAVNVWEGGFGFDGSE